MSDTTDAALAIARELNRLEEDNRRLAAKLAEAEARAARLRGAVLTLGALANAWRSPYHPDPLGEDAQSEMGLQPGDLDDPEVQP